MQNKRVHRHASHPIPKGYRRLKVGEIIRETDLLNAKINEVPFDEKDHGFIFADDNAGHKVKAHDCCAYYRQRKSNQKAANHPCPEGYRRLGEHETLRPDDYGNAIQNSCAAPGPLTDDCNNLGFLSCRILGVAGRRVSVFEGTLAFYRKV
jgi:hypothetical protein